MRLTHLHRTDLTWTTEAYTGGVAAHLYTAADPADVTDVEDGYHILDLSNGCPEWDADMIDEDGHLYLVLETREYQSRDLAHLESLLGVWLLDGEIESVEQLPAGFAKGYSLGFVIIGSTSPEDNGTPVDWEPGETPGLFSTRLEAESALAAQLQSDPGWADQCGFEEIEATPAAIDPDGWIHWSNGHASPADYRI